MSQSNVRKLLGYSPKDPYLLSESDADDIIDAYRDLVGMAKGEPSFEDLVDGVMSFLDAVAEMDTDGQIEKKLVAALKDRVVADEFKDQVKSVLSVLGEQRLFTGKMRLNESLEDLDSQLTGLDQAIKMSRDFHEVAAEISNFLGKLREMNAELGGSIESEMVNGMAEYMAGMKKLIMSKAKKLGAE